MTDFLLELRSEEIPARMQLKAKDDLARLFTDALAKAGLAATGIETFATPRRLALIAHGLPEETEATSHETKGPRVGAPDQAINGFLNRYGLAKDQLIERDGVYFSIRLAAGRPTSRVIQEAVPDIIRAFPWPKSQRWGSVSISTSSLRWVRPLQGIVALLGDDIVSFEVEGIESGRETIGHRFHSSGPVSIANAASYVETLRAAHVIVHYSERCAIIRDGAAKAAADAGLVLVEDEGLVSENAGLTEWPVPMLGRFDPAFLAVPEEVIQLTARVNQKYFVCRDANGTLAPAFVCTANIVAKDGGAAIVAGNEKVLSARLSDAKFFWETDLKVPLEEQAKKLAQITFHEKLGTVAQRHERFASLANDFQGQLSGHVAAAGEAASLLKADLVTQMVGEFPELQGLMGGRYALAEGRAPDVAAAIAAHYMPLGQTDALPTEGAAVLAAMMDKVDALAGFFGAGLRPTGSKDPFALRRAGLGLIRLIVEHELRLALKRLFGAAAQLYRNQGLAVADSSDDILDFLADRLKVQQREAGVRHDLIDAVFALGGEDDLVRLLARVRALQDFVGTEDGVNLLAGYKRAANLLKQAGDRGDSDSRHAERVSASMGGPWTLKQVQGDERFGREDLALLTALDTAEPTARAAIAAEDFTAAMAALASLRAPIDAFFDGVMVNDPDPAIRAFRLGLLARFRDAVHAVADFSKIEG